MVNQIINNYLDHKYQLTKVINNNLKQLVNSMIITKGGKDKQPVQEDLFHLIHRNQIAVVNIRVASSSSSSSSSSRLVKPIRVTRKQ